MNWNPTASASPLAVTGMQTLLPAVPVTSPMVKTAVGPPACVTVTVFGLPEVAPGAVTVMFAVRALPGFVVQVTVIVPTPVPEAGEMVHQA